MEKIKRNFRAKMINKLLNKNSLGWKFLAISVSVFLLSSIFYYTTGNSRNTLITQNQNRLDSVKEPLKLCYKFNLNYLPQEFCITENGAISKVSQLFQLFFVFYYFPPASFSDVAKSTLVKLGVFPSVYAQGVGLGLLGGFYYIWKTSLTISYVLLSIGIIFLGILLLLNKGVDNRVVITLEVLLPKIVITVVLMYFSYAIVGFLVDLSYILSYLILLFLRHIPVLGSTTLISRIVPEMSFLDLIDDVGGPIYGNAAGTFKSFFFNVVLHKAVFASVFALFLALKGFIEIVGAPIGYLIEGIAGLLKTEVTVFGTGVKLGDVTGWLKLAFFILSLFLFIVFLDLILASFAVFYFIFQYLNLLLGAYIRIIINLIFAPFFLLLNIFPGKSGFGDWIKSLAADILVFPLVFLFFGIAVLIFSIPVDLSLPLLRGLPPTFVQSVAAAGVLFMAPGLVGNLTNKIRSLSFYDQANIGTAFSSPISQIQQTAGQLTNLVNPQGLALFGKAFGGRYWRPGRGGKGGAVGV